MNKLFEDVVLERIAFREGKRDLEFRFGDYYSGTLGEIVCENVFAFNFNTLYRKDEETFPCFVKKVEFSRLKEDEIILMFEKLGHGTECHSGVAPSKEHKYHYVKVEGGPVCIRIICEKVESKKVLEDTEELEELEAVEEVAKKNEKKQSQELDTEKETMENS